MKKFSFERPIDEAAMQRNWDQLINNTHAQEYDPFGGATPASAGFADVDLYWGTYALQGPVVFFSINMHSSGVVSWSAGDELLLPIELATRGTGFALQYGMSFPVTRYNGYVTNVGTGNICVFSSNDGLVIVANESGSCAEFSCAGWYFRD